MRAEGLPVPSQKELMLTERHFDVLRGRGNGYDYFVGADGSVHEFVMSARAFTPTEFEQLLRAEGLTPERVYGDWSGGEFCVECPKILFLATKTG